MGIKNFTKVFEPTQELSYKAFRKHGIRTIAIDALSELYRALKSPITLTDSKGAYTHHLAILIQNILERRKNGIFEIWVFDPLDANPMKSAETRKRQLQKRKQKAKFEEASGERSAAQKLRQEKCMISITQELLDEFMYILTSFNIPYVIAPSGFEGEHIAACLTQSRSRIADAVYTNDADALLFGARHMILRRRNHKAKKTSMLLYDRAKTLEQYDLQQTDLIKAGIALGCDFCPKTPRIGQKTVLKKLDSIELTEKQSKALEYFQQPCSFKELAWHNVKGKPFDNPDAIDQLLLYLVRQKKFKEDVWRRRFAVLMPESQSV